MYVCVCEWLACGQQYKIHSEDNKFSNVKIPVYKLSPIMFFFVKMSLHLLSFGSHSDYFDDYININKVQFHGGHFCLA